MKLTGNGTLTLTCTGLTNQGGVQIVDDATVDLNNREWTIAKVSGGGQIINGTLSTTILAGEGMAAPTFSNMTLKDITIDLGFAADARHPPAGTTYTVAKFGDNVSGVTAEDVGVWKFANVGKYGYLTFALGTDGKSVLARVGSTEGTILILR